MKPQKIVLDNFEEFYKQFYTPIWRYVYARTGFREEADDITQTIFLKIYEIALKENKEITISYLYTSAKNLIIDRGKKKKEISVNCVESELGEFPDDKQNPQKDFEAIETEVKIKEALNVIQPEQSESLELKYLLDFSNKEIAEIMGKKEEAIRQLQSRGIRAMREYFNNKDNE